MVAARRRGARLHRKWGAAIGNPGAFGARWRAASTPYGHRRPGRARMIIKAVRIVLVSTYELGRQPFGLASPAAWLRGAGHEVVVADVSCGPLPLAAIEQAGLVAFFLPMHTATRLFL